MSNGLPPSGEYLGGRRSGGTSRSTPIAFSVPGWTNNGLLVSICACLAHIYVHGEARLDTFHHKIIHLREYTSTRVPNLFLSVIAFMYEEGHTRDLCFA